MQAVFPTQSLATFERQCREPHPYKRIWTRLSSSPSKPGFLVPRQQTRQARCISRSFAEKTVTTIQRSPEGQSQELLQISARIYWWQDPEAATAEAAKIRFRHPILAYQHWRQSPRISPSQEGD
ncbi:hypothetical protein BASA81_017226 [Batrachochytrium salamandrivorans]|nr:hypothetical protein BASA81_017226 [Batrachochytrium salamandrivorans]